jgi:hypothetical protein
MTNGAHQRCSQSRATQSRVAAVAAFGGDLSEAAERMARDCAISTRQAYRYLEQARSLKAPVAVGDEKVAFTVKLPRGLVRQVRDYARARRLSLSELVGRALRRLLARG